MEIFAIPTNRDIERALHSICREVKAMQIECLILILDNSSDIIREKNQMTINKYIQSDFNILWFDLDKQKKFIKNLANRCKLDYQELKQLLYTEKCDYGKIFNLLYLLVIALGGNSFHRRDSDCYVEEVEINKFPCYMEEKYLGKVIKSVDISEKCPTNYSKNDRIYIVGSDYIGNWNLDLQELSDGDSSALESFYSLSNINPNEQKEFLDKKYRNCNIQFYSRAMFDYEKDLYQWAEMGNISMFEIFKYVPNFIGENAIGFDYHTYNMACIFQIPSIYHPNKILHKHEQNRKSIESQKMYWKGMYKLNDYNLIIKEFEEKYFCTSRMMGIEGLKEGVYSGNIVETFEKIFDEMIEEKRLNIFEIISKQILNKSDKDIYREISQWLIRNRKDIIEEVNKEYKLSFKLFKLWKLIVDECESNSNIYVKELWN